MVHLLHGCFLSHDECEMASERVPLTSKAWKALTTERQISKSFYVVEKDGFGLSRLPNCYYLPLCWPFGLPDSSIHSNYAKL